MSLARLAVPKTGVQSLRVVHGELRGLHSSCQRAAVTNFKMPAMSPTMTEGGVSAWKFKEGQSFSAGEVLLEIETDKATIDVEAQEDGIMGKILVPDNSKNVPVGRIIALLAEEGDDISNLEAPKEEPARPAQPSSNSVKEVKSTQPSPPKSETDSKTSQSTPVTKTPHKLQHPGPMFPSVMRLLLENGLSPEKVKGTGRRGMLTKGDVLAFMGRASKPTGSWTPVNESPIPKKSEKQSDKKTELDAPTLRRLIVEGMSSLSRSPGLSSSDVRPTTFDSIIADYIPKLKTKSTKSNVNLIHVSDLQKQLGVPVREKAPRDYLEGLV